MIKTEGVVAKAWDPLIDVLRSGILVGNKFPASYNQALITGWLAYAERALKKMEVGDAVLLTRCMELYSHSAKELAICLEEPTLLRRASLSHLERLAEEFESRVVELGLLPRLDMLRLDDMDPKP